MNFKLVTNRLLILSRHFETYSQIIGDRCLPGLSILAAAHPEDVNRGISECDIVFGEPSLVSKVIEQMQRVKWVQSSWAGVEPLLAPQLRHDYLLTNIRNVYGPLISEYVFSYLLMIERKIVSRRYAQSEKMWDSSLSGTLQGKLLGLLGVGSIGAHMALTAKNFGMRVYGFTRMSESCQAVDRYYHAGNWKEFASDLDYLVCTLPGTKDTNDLVDAEAISALPQKAWLINVGRGSTLDESALLGALENQRIAGAVLDVFKEEPLPAQHPFWVTPNIYITFHTAAQNNPPDIASVFIENYMRYIRGDSLNYLVNYEVGY